MTVEAVSEPVERLAEYIENYPSPRWAMVEPQKIAVDMFEQNEVTFWGEGYTMNHNALDSLCQLCKISPKSYRLLRSAHRSGAAQALTSRISTFRKNPLMIRVVDSQMEAAYSRSYLRVESREVARQVVAPALETDIFTDLIIIESGGRSTFVLLSDLKVDDQRLGIRFYNDVWGNGSLRGDAMLFRYACSNGMVLGKTLFEGYARNHRGSRILQSGVWLDYPELPDSIRREMLTTLDNFARAVPEHQRKLETAIRLARAQQLVDADDLLEETAGVVPYAKEVVEELTSFTDPVYSDWSAYSFLNAMTALARKSSGQKRDRLEALAGDMLVKGPTHRMLRRTLATAEA